MRNVLEARLPDLSRLLRVLHVELLVDGVVDPQPDVATPEALLLKVSWLNGKVQTGAL